MRTRASSADQGRIARWQLLIRDECVLAVVAAWLLTSCIAVGAAQDLKSGEAAKTAAAQKNAPDTKDGETKIANDATSAACKIKSDDPPILTHTGNAASLEKRVDREGMSKGSNEASSGENLTLRAPAREELTDPMQLDAEPATKEESRNETSVNSKTGPELKCTRRGAATKSEPAISN